MEYLPRTHAPGQVVHKFPEDIKHIQANATRCIVATADVGVIGAYTLWMHTGQEWEPIATEVQHWILTGQRVAVMYTSLEIWVWDFKAAASRVVADGLLLDATAHSITVRHGETVETITC